MAQHWNKETPDRQESVYITNDGTSERRERIVTDTAAERRNMTYTITQLIWLFFGIVMSLIGLRIILMLMAANPANTFASFVYSVTDLFLWPFFGLTTTPSAGGMVLDVPAIIAIFVYALLAWAVTKIIKILMLRPSASRSIETYDRERR
jgi:hypothetical protein